MKYILLITIALFTISCSTNKVETKKIIITKNKYVFSKIYIPDSELSKNKKIKIPTITSNLNKKNLNKIENYITDLYISNKLYESKIDNIKSIVSRYNRSGDNNESK